MKQESRGSPGMIWRRLRESQPYLRARDILTRRATPRARILWGVAGLILGVILTAVVLIVIAPQPPAVNTPSTTGNISVTLDDAALSDLTAAGLAQAKLPFTVTNVYAHVHPDNVVDITGDVPLLGGIVIRRLAVTAALSAEQGHIVMHVQRATVGSLGLPAVVTHAFESAFNARSAELTNALDIQGTRYEVSGVSSTEGKLTLNLSRVG